MYKTLKPIIEYFRIYTQIDDFLTWKSRFSIVGDRKGTLYSLVKVTQKRNLSNITMEDLMAFKRYTYSISRTNTEIIHAMTSLRCLLRYHRKRGLLCIRPDVVGKLDINIKGVTSRYPQESFRTLLR